ncbi:MAG TPA: SpoIIE family protein phosphatase, partial [Blastocatellia bacterium]|nr:SpoIIE family protein phosphatase [Blastocatellia bacterium]
MKTRYISYAILTLLFVVASVFQARYSYDQVRFLLGYGTGIYWPVYSQRYSPVVADVEQPAPDGLHRGDQILTVEGQPFTGRSGLLDALKRSKHGDSILLGVRHRAEENLPDEELRIPVREITRRRASVAEWLVTAVLNLAMPAFCILLGFGVAALKPKDPLAWLLLALLLSFSRIMTGIDALAWSGWLRDVMVFYHTLFQGIWPTTMLLFGIYFPERWVVDRKAPWFKWMFIVPNLIFALKDVVLAEGNLRSLAVAAAVYTFFRNLELLEIILGIASVGLFFAAIGHKTGTATNPDARRRLRLFQAGTTLGITPAFGIFIASLIKGVPPNQAVPAWLLIPAWLLLFLFPLTFAYVIVVHRALDVRVVIRQGVRYAFARGGVLALRFILIAAIIAVMATQLNRPDVRSVEVIAIVGIGVALIFMMRRIGERLIRWTDRRFFREAYSSEQILNDLSDKVRTMVETGPLLETIAHKISESLHVPRVALLLEKGGTYTPAYALGYSTQPAVGFDQNAATIERLRKENQPVRVYLDDDDSWVNRIPGIDGERKVLEALDTQLLLPLATKEKLPGFISLGPKQSEEAYSSTDLGLLQSVATQAALALENSQLTAAIAKEVSQRERLNRELEIAREVQERLFPQTLPVISGLDYSGACRPALGVGGDYYDFLLLPGELFGIAIGDVSGKGIAAALLMASLQASLRGQATRGTNDLADLMANVNRLVYDASSENRYATFFYSQYNPSSRELTYVNAGHNPPLILRKTGNEWEVIRLEVGGAVVGLLRDFPYSQGTVKLEPGDLIVAFTDG